MPTRPNEQGRLCREWERQVVIFACLPRTNKSRISVCRFPAKGVTLNIQSAVADVRRGQVLPMETVFIPLWVGQPEVNESQPGSCRFPLHGLTRTQWPTKPPRMREVWARG
jgi:hypothetical protein